MPDAAARPYGIVAEFTTASSALHAAEKVRQAGFRQWDVFTPFPVHGMDKAMGLRNLRHQPAHAPGPNRCLTL